VAVYPNRYSLMMFMPLAVLLATRGEQLLSRWVGADFARHSAPVLPILLLGYVLAIVGQFSSSMFLIGSGKHRRYARGVLTEACVTIAVLWWVVPVYGIVGAAWVVTTTMIVNRGFFGSWLVCREIGMPWLTYIRSVYLAPFASAVIPAGCSLWLARTVLPDATWPQILAHAVVIGVVYLIPAWTFCLAPEHRNTVKVSVTHAALRWLPATQTR